MLHRKPDSVIRLKLENTGELFEKWLMFLRPFHSFSPKELEIAAAFLDRRHQYENSVTDRSLLDRIVFSEEVKKEIRTEKKMSVQHFQIVMSNLRKKGFIEDNIINPKYIPHFKQNDGVFELLLRFEYKTSEEDIQTGC